MALIDNLVAYWPLDEASGSAIDAHDDNDLAEDSGTIGAATGIVGGARDFEAGDTERFILADNADLSTGDIDFTIAFWVQFESLAATADLVSKFLTTGNQREYIVLYSSGSTQFSFVVSATGSSTTGTVNASTFGTPTTATWYFVVAWHDSAANTINISVNAGTADSTSHSTGVFDGTAAFTLGARDGSLGTPLDGLLDEVGFWKRVLTGDEIAELYNGGAGRDYAYIVGGSPAGHPAMRRFSQTRSGLLLPRHRPIEIGREGVLVA